MKNLLYITFILIITSSCSEYQKALKSTNIAEKFAMGTELYDDGKFGKANRLFVQIVPKYRGKPQAEKLMYMYSRTFYEMRDFYTANYQMERFVNAYPESIKAEEIAFLAGLQIVGTDRVGMINDLTKLISNELKVNMRSITVDSDGGIFEGTIKLYVNNTEHLDQLIKNLNQIEGVIKVSRFD